jgi:DNA polymerase I-like protein with 3'-5' exonuclease and polymerase domains
MTNLLDRASDVPNVLTWIDALDVLVVDTETSGLSPYGLRDGRDIARICGLVLGDMAGNACYLPFRHGQGANLDTRYLREILEHIAYRVEHKSLTLALWNAKFDLHMMSADGFPPVRDGIEDWMLAAHLFNENEPSFGLKEFADRYQIGTGSLDERELRITIEDKLGVKTLDKSWKGHLWKLDPADVAAYAESDAILTAQLREALTPQLEKRDLLPLFREVNRYMLLITRMEQRGLLLDVDRINQHIADGAPTLERTRARIREIVIEETGSDLDPIVKKGKVSKITGNVGKTPERKPFNPGSPNQVAALTGWPSTDRAFLESFGEDADWHEFANLILDYRVLDKMNGTYYDAYLSLIDADYVLRPNFNMHGTVSGRLSCSRPNIQNVPRYTPVRRVKDAFVSREGFVWLEMDFQAAELRIATHYAKMFGNVDQMLGVLRAGGDPHGSVAQRLGVTRHTAKTLNFLVIYGGGIRAIMKLLKCDEATARDYLNAYHALNPGFRKFSDAMQAQAEQNGYITLDTGRRRRFDTYKRFAWEIEPRKAMNSFVQGTSAEMLRVGMTRADDRFHAESIEAYMLAQVHDSLITEVRDDPATIARTCRILREEMTAFAFDPHPDIEIKIGTRWGQMEPFEG